VGPANSRAGGELRERRYCIKDDAHARSSDHPFCWRDIEGRRALRLTQKELAEKAGLGQAEVSKIERGRKSPTLDTCSRIAAALGFRVPPLARPRRRRRAA
jgi:DNA-binding XRE family transcriptional regulator